MEKELPENRKLSNNSMLYALSTLDGMAGDQN